MAKKKHQVQKKEGNATRKLCILKGVFPREPKKKVKGNHHTCYHLKDLQYIQNDPPEEKAKEAAKNDRKLKALQEEHFEGLKVELKGVPPASSISKSDHQISAKSTEDSDPDSEQIVKDKNALELLTMSKKKQGLIDAIMIGKKRKQDNAAVLKDRNRKLSESQN